MIRARHALAVLLGIGWLAAFTILIQSSSWSPSDSEEWFPFIMPWDDGTPSFVGPWLESPAGRHGFVQASPDGDFYFADGQPIRFWGVALGPQLSAPPKEFAEKLASRLAKLGFNLVRIRGVDLMLFEPGAQDTRHLDEERLDRFDYLVSRLKARGIYIDLVLYGDRRFRGDGVIDGNAPQFTQTYEGQRLLRSMAIADPYLLMLQREFTQQFLTHRNPYTRTTYAEEPAVAMLEIINETSLTYGWLRDFLNEDSPEPIRITPYYSKLLDVRWNLWLQGRYGSRTALEDAWRPTDPDRIGLLPEEDPQRGTVRRILYSERERYSQARVEDTLKFYSELERDYFLGMYAFLKELGVRVPISGTHTFHGMANQFVQAQLDFTGGHAQWQHPIFLRNQSWREPPIRVINTPMVLGEEANIPYKADWIETRNTLFRLAYGMTAANKPFVISEYNHAFPNEYQSEFPLILSAYSSLQRWDAAIIHVYVSRPQDFDMQRLYDAFAIHNNPVILAQMPVASLLFRKGYVRRAQEWVTIPYAEKQAFSAFLECGLDIYCVLASRGVEPEIALVHGIDNQFAVTGLKHEAEEFSPGVRSPYVSDTGELTWDRQRGLVMIDTDIVQAVIGFVGRQVIRLRYLTIRARTDFAAISLISLDGRPIPRSKKLLLAAVSRVKNQNMEMRRDVSGLYLLTDWGDDQILVQDVQAEVQLRHEDPNDLKLFRLDERGRLDAELEHFVQQGELRFGIGNQKTLWYALCVPRGSCDGLDTDSKVHQGSR
jgi:hypothetical protein